MAVFNKVVVKSTNYTLNLNAEEVVALKCILGKVGGGTMLTRTTDRIYDALPEEIDSNSVPAKNDSSLIFCSGEDKQFMELAKWFAGT